MFAPNQVCFYILHQYLVTLQMQTTDSSPLISISGPTPAPRQGRISIPPLEIVIPSHLLAACTHGTLGIQARIATNVLIATAVIPAPKPHHQELGVARAAGVPAPIQSRPQVMPMFGSAPPRRAPVAEETPRPSQKPTPTESRVSPRAISAPSRLPPPAQELDDIPF